MKKLSQKKLDGLIDEATIDCYDDYESRMGFYTMLEDNLSFPFKAKVVGEEVKIIGIASENERIDAICQRNGKKYSVDILNIDYNPSEVIGSEWIEAYRKWSEAT